MITIMIGLLHLISAPCQGLNFQRGSAISHISQTSLFQFTDGSTRGGFPEGFNTFLKGGWDKIWVKQFSKIPNFQISLLFNLYYFTSKKVTFNSGNRRNNSEEDLQISRMSSSPTNKGIFPINVTERNYS